MKEKLENLARELKGGTREEMHVAALLYTILAALQSGKIEVLSSRFQPIAQQMHIELVQEIADAKARQQ